MSLGLLLAGRPGALFALLLRWHCTSPVAPSRRRRFSPRYAGCGFGSGHSRRFRFEEWPLLALRLLLLTALALLLAEPVLYGAPGSARWVVVETGIDRAEARAAVAAPHAEWRWLASGYPTLERDPPAGTLPLASLLRELDAALPDDAPLTVVVPAQLDGLDGERVVLRRQVEWRVIESGESQPPVAPPGPAVLAVRHARPDDPALRYLRATAVAWRTAAAGPDERRVRVEVAPAGEPVEPDVGWLVWLVPGALRPGVRAVDRGRRHRAAGCGHGAARSRPRRRPLAQCARRGAGDGRALGNGRVMSTDAANWRRLLCRSTTIPTFRFACACCSTRRRSPTAPSHQPRRRAPGDWSCLPCRRPLHRGWPARRDLVRDRALARPRRGPASARRERGRRTRGSRAAPRGDVVRRSSSRCRCR